VRTLLSTGMHALAIPPYLLVKEDEPPVPDESWERPTRTVETPAGWNP
jgi:hypothetical protein